MENNQVSKVNTSMQTDSSENVIINKSSLLLFLIRVDLKLQDLLSKTNCTAFKVKILYERLLEEFDAIDKYSLTVQETCVKRNLQDLNSVCKENSKDIVKVISGYYSSMNEQFVSTDSCTGNLYENTKYFTDLLTSFLSLSSSFEKQSWFSDIFLESSLKWEPISFQTGNQPREAISSESNVAMSVDVQYENDDNSDNSSITIGYRHSLHRISWNIFDSRNTFTIDLPSEVDWKNRIESLKRTSLSLEIVQMKFFILRSRDIHFLQTLSSFDISK